MLYAYGILRRLGVAPWATTLAFGFLIFDRGQIFYSVSGMEGQVAVAVLLGGM
jgi:hypothetical protein